jgi:hypothetical protein
MKLHSHKKSLGSNYGQIRPLYIFRPFKTRERKASKGHSLPSPEENNLRLRISFAKAKVERVAWMEARIAKLEGMAWV